MKRNFAWPVFHRPAGDYDNVADAAKKGRDFKQPLLANGADFSSGLELWIKDEKDSLQQEELGTLFVCWDGMLSLYPAKNADPACLALEPTNLSFLKIVEAKPIILYGNVDLTKVRSIMIAMILALYNGNKDHPILTSVIFRVTQLELDAQKGSEAEQKQATGNPSKGTPLKKKKKKKPLAKQNLKERLTGAADDSERMTILSQLIDDWILNSGVDRNLRLPVKAGDRIGAPGSAFGGTTGPAGYPLHLVLQFFDTSWKNVKNAKKKGYHHEVEQYQQVRNPMHDLWIWLDSSAVTKLAPPNFGDAHPHPIVALTGLSAAAPKPTSRLEVDTDGLRPFPLIDLATEWHDHDSSTIQWRLKDNVAIEAQLKGTSGTLPNLDPSTTLPGSTTTTFDKLASDIWTQHGNDIADMAKFFQVPCELIMAIMGVEDTGLTGTRVRFEGFRLPSGDTSREAKLYETLFVYPTGGSKTAPLTSGVIDGKAVIGKVGSDEFTWNDLMTLLMKPAFQGKVSPGLMQTLISTASGILDSVEDWYADILHDKGVVEKATVWKTLGVDPRPASDSELLTWLLKPRSSLLAGVAYMRMNYNLQGTAWNPPLVAAAYNASTIQNPSSSDKTWGLLLFDDQYMQKFAPLFNASVSYLTGTVGVNPHVRMQR